LLLEQRDLSEAQYDRSEQAKAELQLANVELTQRISELTTLHEVGQALSATLDLDDLLEKSLRAVVTHLNYDRALLMLADEEERALTAGHSVGGTPDMREIVERLRFSLDEQGNDLVDLFHADRPLIFAGTGGHRQLTRALEVSSFLGTPLITKGRRVGILAVDNGLTRRPIATADADLLFTIGNQIATAVESARLYRQIESQNRTLEQRVAQRTEELARATAEAQEARAAAEAANEAKSAFLANVSHELRTPLTSILGFTKIIKKRLDDVVFPAVGIGDQGSGIGSASGPDPRSKTERAMRQVSENIGIIIAEGERLTAMINDVLDLAKIESGKLEWKMERTSISEIIERATNATSSLFAQKGLDLVVDVPDDLPEIAGDKDRLIQVVINLLSNAVKFTDEGGVTCRAVAAGDELVVSVIDTGMGIAPEDHEKVFEQFKQVGDTLTDKPKGTGLGLPICKQIVEHHGGRIWLESDRGCGSVFSFALQIGAVA
jgi:signal transduction histidine kinase